MTITEKPSKEKIKKEEKPTQMPPRQTMVQLEKMQDEAAKQKEKEKADQEKKSLEAIKNEVKLKLPFHVLGFNSQRQVLIWYKGRIVTHPVTSLKADDLSLYVGVYSSVPQGQPNPAAILKEIILEEAHKKGLIDDETPISSGIWRFNNEWIVVSGRKAAKIKDGKLEYLETPIVGGRVIQFEKDSWIDLKNLERKIPAADLKRAFRKARELVSQWVWYDPEMVDFVAAFVMLLAFQYVMRWRPWLYILGAAGTGKSSFLEYIIEEIFRCLVKRIDKGTAHSTAQAIGNSGRIGVFDEFEKSPKLSELLEAFKLFNRGGNYTRGTTGDKAKEYGMHHMPIMASISLPKTFSTDRAQLSRVVKFELKKIPEGKYLVGMTDEEAQELACDIVASMFSVWDRVEEGVREIERTKEKYVKECGGKIDGRCVENLMYAMALLEVIDEEEGKAEQKRKIPEWAIEEFQDDAENILEAIIMSKIRYSADEFLVVDLIHKALGEPVNLTAMSVDVVNESFAKDLLRKHGLSVVSKPEGWFLAVIPKEVSKHLLKNDEAYRGLDIKPFLKRLAGVDKNDKKTDWGGQNKLWAMHIPGNHVNTITG